MRLLIKIRDGTRGYNGGNGMLVDKLGGFTHRVEENGKGIKSAYHPTQLDAANKIDRYADILFADLIQEDVLEIQLWFIHFGTPPCRKFRENKRWPSGRI